jgi:rhodanese-related sulfurtransferase
LTGLTNPPGYFPKNVLMNINGYESIDAVMSRGKKPLSPIEFETIANETHVLILDTRPSADFAKGFIPNSINIGLDGSFAMWVGEMITDIKQEILLVTEPGKEEETMIRLSRVGYDHTIGYLNGGFNSWLKTGKEIDTINRISALELEYHMAKEKLTIIDVRKKSEFDSEHLLDAINIPLNEINNHLAEFPKDKIYVLHCAGGYRSIIAGSLLKQRGWDNFVDVSDGFVGIKNTKLPKTNYVCPTTLL